MSAPKAPRRPKALNVEKAKRSQEKESLQKASNGLIALQYRLYVAKSQISGAHAFAHAQEENSDIALMLDAAAGELESIANDMGNFLPLYIPAAKGGAQ